jgi:uncharacterized protein YceK
MRSSDIISLYQIVGWGAEVTIVDAPLASAIPTLALPTQLAATNQSTTSEIR